MASGVYAYHRVRDPSAHEKKHPACAYPVDSVPGRSQHIATSTGYRYVQGTGYDDYARIEWAVSTGGYAVRNQGGEVSTRVRYAILGVPIERALDIVLVGYLRRPVVRSSNQAKKKTEFVLMA